MVNKQTRKSASEIMINYYIYHSNSYSVDSYTFSNRIEIKVRLVHITSKNASVQLSLVDPNRGPCVPKLMFLIQYSLLYLNNIIDSSPAYELLQNTYRSIANDTVH